MVTPLKAAPLEESDVGKIAEDVPLRITTFEAGSRVSTSVAAAVSKVAGPDSSDDGMRDVGTRAPSNLAFVSPLEGIDMVGDDHWQEAPRDVPMCVVDFPLADTEDAFGVLAALTSSSHTTMAGLDLVDSDDSLAFGGLKELPRDIVDFITNELCKIGAVAVQLPAARPSHESHSVCRRWKVNCAVGSQPTTRKRGSGKFVAKKSKRAGCGARRTR